MKLTCVLWAAADGERMPFVLGDGRDVDEEIVSSPEPEIVWPGNREVSHLQWFARVKVQCLSPLCPCISD